MQNTHYERLGGETGVRALVERFYDLMDSLPEVSRLRQIHAPDLGEAREKLFLFLTGWTGGPPLYMEKYGHPRLRQRHMGFPIGTRERDEWMLCMTRAMEETGVETSLREELIQAFFKTADFMRNRPD